MAYSKKLAYSKNYPSYHHMALSPLSGLTSSCTSGAFMKTCLLLLFCANDKLHATVCKSSKYINTIISSKARMNSPNRI